MGGREVDYSFPGLRIRILASGGIEVRSAEPLEGWVAHCELSHVISPAVHYRDDWYMIESEEADRDGGVLYRLVPWPDNRAVRKKFELELEEWLALRQEAEQLERYRRWNGAGWAMELATGWLPGRWQEAFSHRYPTDPVRASFRNAMLFYLPVGVGMIETFAVGLAGGQWGGMFGFTSFTWLMIALYCVVEASTRVAIVMTHDEPFGLLPLEIGERLLHALAHAFHDFRASRGGQPPPG